eukprot:15742650-Heterocapsa_arctica.AAC.1
MLVLTQEKQSKHQQQHTTTNTQHTTQQQQTTTNNIEIVVEVFGDTVPSGRALAITVGCATTF